MLWTPKRTITFALKSQSFLNILILRKTFSHIYLYNYHFLCSLSYLCLDPSFSFPLPNKYPWTFLILLVCWQIIFLVFCLFESLYLALILEIIFPIHWISRLIYLLLCCCLSFLSFFQWGQEPRRTNSTRNNGIGD